MGECGSPTSHCNSCQERLDIEQEQRQEVERLRACWTRLRQEITQVNEHLKNL